MYKFKYECFIYYIKMRLKIINLTILFFLVVLSLNFIVSEDVPIGDAVCTPSWNCSEWSNCTSGLQTKVCLDDNNCSVSDGKPEEEQTCEVVINNCEPYWDCSDWTPAVCSPDINQTRNCIDTNTCNSTDNLREEISVCPPKEPFNWYGLALIIVTLIVLILLIWLGRKEYIKYKQRKQDELARMQQIPRTPFGRMQPRMPFTNNMMPRPGMPPNNNPNTQQNWQNNNR